MKTCSLLLFVGVMLAFTSGCSQQKEQRIWDPLVVKYVQSTVLMRSGDEVFAEDWSQNPPKRKHIGWSQEKWNPDPSYGGFGWSDYHTDFAQILKDSHVVVSNALVANDVKCLVDEVMTINVNSAFLVDSITCSQNVWIVESGYYGGPDDQHRRPSKVVTKIYTDTTGLITNIIKDIYPRPMDLETQNKASEDTSQ